MAYTRRRKGAWQCVVRVAGYPPITKTFNTKIDAQRYSRDLENKLFRQKHDIAKKKFPIMREALIRYRDEVVAHKRSKDMDPIIIPEPYREDPHLKALGDKVFGNHRRDVEEKNKLSGIETILGIKA